MPENILALKDKFDVFLLDIYGVIWNGKEPVSGALKAMEDLKKAGKTVILLSNGTQRSAAAETSNLKRGFVKGVHYDRIVTSGELAYETFSEDDRKLKFYQFGRRNEALFADCGYKELKEPDDADFVYIGVPQTFDGEIWRDYLTLAPFEEELNALFEKGLPLICANPDMRAHEKQFADAVVRQGSVARFYEDLGGEVEYFGKPYPQIFDYALQNVDAVDDRILMVGDTLETDILGGNAYGIKTALVCGGIAEENMREEGFDDLAAYAQELEILPDYILKSI